jgi:hypothetical protein
MMAVLCLALASCSAAPDLSHRISQTESSTAWPSLLSNTALAEISQTEQTISERSSTADLTARVAALRSRASHLQRRSVLTPAERARLIAAIARQN